MDYNTFLDNFGTFGWFTVVLLLINGMAGSSMTSLNGFVANFLGTANDHRCKPHGSLTSLPLDEQLKMGIPLDDKGSYDSCYMYSDPTNYTDDMNNTVSECTDGWLYDNPYNQRTFVMEWNLVCGDAIINSLTIPLFILGQFVGSLFCGSISNTLGRKRAMLAMMSLCSLSGMAAGASNNIYMFIAMRFLIGATSVNMLSIGYVLAKELCPPAYGDLSSLIHNLFYSMGGLLIAGIAYFVRGWRWLQFTCALTILPLMVIMAIVVPESPRWLIWRGDRKTAAKVLGKIATFNGAKVAAMPAKDNYQNRPKKKKSKDKTEAEVPPVSEGTYGDIFRSRVTRRALLTVSFSWATTAFMFFAVSFNLDSLFGDLYTNMSVCAGLEMLSFIGATICARKFGRVRTIVVTLIIAMLAGATGIYALEMGDMAIVVTLCAMVCRSCGCAGNHVVIIIILELFPTPIKNLVLGFASAVTYCICMAAPVVAGQLTAFWLPLPYAVYTAMALVAALLNCWLPETNGITAPETIEELEALKSGKPSQKDQNIIFAVTGVTDDDKTKKEQVNLAFTPDKDPEKSCTVEIPEPKVATEKINSMLNDVFLNMDNEPPSYDVVVPDDTVTRDRVPTVDLEQMGVPTPVARTYLDLIEGNRVSLPEMEADFYITIL